MKRLSVPAFIFAVLFFACSCASSPEKLVYPDGRIIPDDFSGIVHAGQVHSGDIDTGNEYSYLNYLGAKWTLHTFNWHRIEPRQGEWNFQIYDNLVNEAAEANIKVLGILAYDNTWIHPDGKRCFYIPPDKIPDFLEYVRRTAEHFRGRIGAWCIWNEPNFFFWAGSDEEFIELSRQTADAVREVDSDVILLGGAFNRGFFGLPVKFIRALFESGAMEKVDAVAFHPYELNPSRSASLYNNFKKIVADYGFEDKIWVTETGYPTGGWYPTKTSEKRFPEYVIKTWTLLASAGANRLFWFQLFDPVNRNNNDSEDFFGLVRSAEDYTSKGAEAYRLCSAYAADSVCYTQIPAQDYSTYNAPNNIKAFWFKKENSSALVLWKEGGGSARLTLNLPGSGHLRHNIATGETESMLSETVLTIGNEPVFITWDDNKKSIAF